MIKKLFFLLITYINLFTLKANGSFSQTDVDPWNETLGKQYWYAWLETIFQFFRDSIFSLILITCLWIFIYIWARLFMARWNPEEFKKSILSFVYVVIWIAVIAFAWALIKFSSWIDF